MILYYDRDGNALDWEEWARLFHDLSYKHVRLTALDDEVEISTVWTGIDHSFGMGGPPLPFETLVFGGELDGHQWHWPNLDAADAGHEQVVAEVKGRLGV